MRTFLDVIQNIKPERGHHPEHWFGPAEKYDRGFRISFLGRDRVEHWQVKGRIWKRWVRVA